MSDRPNPLARVASTVGVAWAAVASILGALVAFGVLSSAQASSIQDVGAAAPDTITALGTVIAGVMAMAGGIVAAWRTATHGKDEVTPVSSPRDNDGNVLVPRGPFADGGPGA